LREWFESKASEPEAEKGGCEIAIEAIAAADASD